ncbi:UDP-N-acetylmuramate--L-alanine ligase [Candidatus Nomurabacteria bacterium]|nr:UDP-N-acetylmuramate--L-alanine ligase [Candidatus Nomurabacteria bacterium]
MDLDLAKVNKVYLSGLGGIGLSAVAYYFLSQGKSVSGSDLTKSEITKRLENQGVLVNYQQKETNIKEGFDLLVYTSALPEDHPELVKARNLKIPTLSYFQFLGILSKDYQTIAVTGTNGKTTTTAMLGLILEKAGLDPTVIVGSLVPQWGKNFRLGKSDILVVEACEWKAHMLELNPNIIVLTNVAEDHLDFYQDLDDIKKHFQKFVNKLPSDGILIKNIDDQNSQNIVNQNRNLLFGQNKKADCYFADLEVSAGQQEFKVYLDEKLFGDFHLTVPGLYNVYNALAAITVASHLGLNKHQIWNALNEFVGTWRRFELLGNFKSNLVISDYAHHPDAIKGLLKAAKDFYPDRKLIAIFQPHHHNRTLTLINDFAKSFDLADQIIISEIYQVGGREDKEHEDVSSLDVLKLISHSKKYYAADFSEVKQIIKKINPVDSVLLFIGAGDIDNLARELVT